MIQFNLYMWIIILIANMTATNIPFWNTVVIPDRVAKITITNVTSATLSLDLEFGFNGNGVLTEVSVLYFATSNKEFNEVETVTFPENETGPVPSRIDITGLQPFTTYRISVEVSNEAGTSSSTTASTTTLPLCKCMLSWCTVWIKIIVVFYFHCLVLYLAPDAPTNVTATLGGLGSELTVSWIVSICIIHIWGYCFTCSKACLIYSHKWITRHLLY